MTFSKRGNRYYVSTIKLQVPRKCLFKCWVNISVPSFGNIQVPSFGQPIKCSNSKRGDRDYVSTIKLGYQENVSSSVWLTFRSPRLVTFRFPRLVNQLNVSKKCIKNSFLYQWRLVIAIVYSGYEKNQWKERNTKCKVWSSFENLYYCAKSQVRGVWYHLLQDFL